MAVAARSMGSLLRSDAIMAAVVIGMLALTVVPLPAPLLDGFLGLSLCMAVLGCVLRGAPARLLGLSHAIALRNPVPTLA